MTDQIKVFLIEFYLRDTPLYIAIKAHNDAEAIAHLLEKFPDFESFKYLRESIYDFNDEIRIGFI